MNQSSTIAFFLLAGFVMFITMKGELVKYAGVMGLGPDAAQMVTSKMGAGNPTFASPSGTAPTPFIDPTGMAS